MLRRGKENLYIDGYNIINDWDQLKALSQISLEEAREKLLDLLVEYRAYADIEIILVFDSYMAKGDRQDYIDRGVRIVFTKEDETADAFIERELYEYGFKKHIRVATSDKLEQEIILQNGGTRVSARELAVEIYNAKRTVNRLANKKRIESQIQMSGINEESLSVLADIKNKLK
ncbi:MAG: NYN domain-containing protein [Tissierellia bacterium]|nr:NYN domain-containing protein [Tissierellia bacterium]